MISSRVISPPSRYRSSSSSSLSATESSRSVRTSSSRALPILGDLYLSDLPCASYS